MYTSRHVARCAPWRAVCYQNQGKIMASSLQIVAAAILLHAIPLLAASQTDNPFLMEPVTLPTNITGPTHISKPAALRMKDGRGVVFYAPSSANDTVNHNTPEYFYPIYCDIFDDCYSFNGLPPGGEIQQGAEFTSATYAMGSTLYLDGATPDYTVAYSLLPNGGQLLTASFYLNQQGCPSGWYLEPGLFGSGVCFSSPGNTWVVWFYPFGPPGSWSYRASTAGATINQIGFTLDPVVVKKTNGDGLTVAAGTSTGPRLIVQIQEKDGTPVPFEKLYNIVVAPTATVKSGRTSTAVPAANIVYKGNAQFSLDVPIAAAGSYTVTVTHPQADPNSPAIFTLTAVAKDPPPDNTPQEQGNGDASNSSDQTSQTQQADQFINKPAGSVTYSGPCPIPEVVADPINVTNGNTLRMEVDYAQTGLSPLEFTRAYNSLGSKSSLMNNYWTTSYDRMVIPPTGNGPARLRRPDGQTVRFNLVGANYVPDPFFHGSLVKTGTGGWTYTDTAQTVETYNSAGKLTSISDLRGRTQTLTYSGKASLLSTVTSNTGESLTFAYNANNQISTVTDQAKRVWTYAYDGYLNLTSVKYPNGIYHQYFYHDNYNPYLLSGVYVGSTNTASLAQAEIAWDYDQNGLATDSYFPDATQATGQLKRTDITYDSDGSTRSLMDGNNNASVYGTQAINGRGFVNTIAGPGVAACGDDLARTFDVSMNVTSKIQAGHVTNYNNYDAKGQFSARVEAVGSTTQRETDYLYDARYFNKPTQIVEPSVVPGQSKVTLLTYDGYGNLTQKTVNGYQPNVNPTMAPVPISRTWSYQYSGPYRQLTQMTGPRTDMAQITKFAYNSTTGRLLSVTDANNIVQRNNLTLTSTGKISAEDHPNGLHIAYAYYSGSDLLQTVTETKGAAVRTTTWFYDNDNRVSGITFSDGVDTDQTINFAYNNAGQLYNVSNAAGNITYTFDAQGNPVNTTYAVGTTTKYAITKTFDAYNRLNKVIGANNTIEYDFYPDGTLTQTKDGKQQVTQRLYDGLKRLTTVIRTDQSQIQYGYDLAGNLDQVTDPNSATTTFVYDDFHNKVAQLSPDTGTTQYTYDLAGNLIQLTDALGQVTRYAYDAGNRLLTVDRVGTAYDETYTYDNCTNGVGQLCSVTNGSGETVANQYDGFGNVGNIKTGNTSGSTSVSYQYDAQSHVTHITYPSGRVVNYLFNGGGQVTAVSVTENGNTTTLASNITYEPFGPVTGWTYGNGLVHTRQYDQQYWARSIATPNVSTLTYSQYDANANLRGLTVDGVSDTFSYDVFDELISGQGDFGSDGYTYDPVGNRQTQTANGANSVLAYTPNSNRITGQTGWSYTLDANGNTTQKLATDGSGSGFHYQYGTNKRLTAVYDLLAPAVPLASYVYNSRGQRTQKVSASGTTRYTYGLDGTLLTETDVSGTSILQEYAYLNGAPMALLGVPQPSNPTAYNTSIDTTGTTSSAWTVKTSSIAVGGSYDYLSMSKAPAETMAYWNFTLPYTGYYDVYVWWVGSGETVTNYTVFTNQPINVPIVSSSQTLGTWVKLGNFHFPAGLESQIRLDSQQNAVASKAFLAADSAKMILTSADAPPNPGYQYVHADHLGAPRAITNASGTVVWKATYQPFGQATINADVTNSGHPTTLNLRFPGQYFDAESGLHYNGLRDYDPGTGRYLTSDPSGLRGGFNTYAYARGNPLRWLDRLGLCPTYAGEYDGEPDLPLQQVNPLAEILVVSALVETLPVELAGAATAEGAAIAAGNGSGITVLGSYPAYVELAEELGANYFSVSAEQWAQMTAAEQWAANQAFLDAAIARGDSFIFSNELAPAGTFFEQELLYLQQQRVFLGVP
jgi:RHS repeat-associated protein